MNTYGICPKILVLLLILSQIVSGQDNSTKCYSELGCFPNTFPWRSIDRPVPPPKDPTAVGTRLYCYTRESEERFNIILWPEIALNGCPFDASRTTVFISHGFSENGNTSWMDLMKTNYLAEKDVNVFLVDWGPGSLNNSYTQAVSNTRIVAAEIARFLQYLRDAFGLGADLVHLIGFSLGSQIMARVSNIFGKVAHITGLDPAAPGYEGYDKAVRLDESDADFVDVIHSSATSLMQNGFGCLKPCGHRDTYVNKGYDQPGCSIPPDVPPIQNLNDLATISGKVAVEMISCSHIRSTYIYAYAIHSCEMWSRKLTEFSTSVVKNLGPIFLQTLGSEEECLEDICVPLGLKAPLYSAKGVFQVNTTSVAPFCIPVPSGKS